MEHVHHTEIPESTREEDLSDVPLRGVYERDDIGYDDTVV
jgi:hypothetical protein